MNKQIISIYIQENFSDSLVGIPKKLENEQPRLYNSIFEYTDYLPNSASFTERCYHLKENLKDRPVCEGCGNLLKFKN